MYLDTIRPLKPSCASALTESHTATFISTSGLIVLDTIMDVFITSKYPASVTAVIKQRQSVMC